MLITGIIIAIIGTAGVFTAVGMEMATREPIYKIFMKIFPWLVGMGLMLIGLSFAIK